MPCMKGAIEIGEGTEIIIIIYTQTKITWEQEGDEKNNMRASDAEAGRKVEAMYATLK